MLMAMAMVMVEQGKESEPGSEAVHVSWIHEELLTERHGHEDLEKWSMDMELVL
jgi:hypothetical protein